MKTTKLILLLALCFAFFNGCSNEETFIEELEEVAEIEKVSVSEEAKTSRVKTKDTKNSSGTANKTLDWFNQNNDDGIEEGDIESNPTMLFIIEFASGLTTQNKYDARERYTNYLGLISYVVCSTNPDKEIWTLNTATYNDDTIPAPLCPGCPPAGGPGSGVKNTHVGNDPDFSRASVSVTTNPCTE